MTHIARISNRHHGPAAFAAIAIVAGFGIAAAATPASAASFVDGKSKGMTKCLRAIFGGYKVNKVNVHGHHFHCYPLFIRADGNRAIRLTHNQVGKDDEVFYYFTVNPLNVIQPDSLRWREIKGLPLRAIWDILPPFNFKAPRGLPRLSDYGDFEQAARQTRPVEVDSWRTAAWQIATVVIAELGNPENRGVAGGKAGRVNCDLPVFYEHDNFRGRGYVAQRSQANLHNVKVSGKHMGDRISSVCLPRGWQVTVYADPNYKGKSYTISGPQSIEDMERQKVSGRKMNWGDKISSVRVRRR